MTYIDDNFGHWDICDEDDRAFYFQVQAESIWKRCVGCGALKKLRPEYYICDGCATKVEHGIDLEDPPIPDEIVDLELQVRRTEQKVEDEISRRTTMDEDGCYEQWED